MNRADILEEWQNKKCVLATMHGKERVIAPIFQKELGIDVFVPENFNTDKYGTFTGDVRRAGNQLEAARKKALAAMELTGAEIGLASEGSFGLHPAAPFLQSNLEIVVLLDRVNGLEIIGHHRSSDVTAQGQAVTSPDEVIAVARAWGFPEQGVILRLSEKSNRHLSKELTTEEDLRRTSEQLLSRPFTRSLFLETDMRAHRCPERMKVIEQATINLIENCKSICPACDTPGFVVTDVVKGLPCSACGSATDLVKETIRSCQKCGHHENMPFENKTVAEPGDCAWCNP